MVEYRLVPLIVSVVKIGDELSAAALTRGLGAPGRRTNLCRIGFHAQDLMAALFCVACFALFLLQPQIAFGRCQRMIQIDHVTFSYGEETEHTGGVRDIELQIKRGEFAVLCGESGCGKTTITRLINGLIPIITKGR